MQIKQPISYPDIWCLMIQALFFIILYREKGSVALTKSASEIY